MVSGKPPPSNGCQTVMHIQITTVTNSAPTHQTTMLTLKACPASSPCQSNLRNRLPQQSSNGERDRSSTSGAALSFSTSTIARCRPSPSNVPTIRRSFPRNPSRVRICGGQVQPAIVTTVSAAVASPACRSAILHSPWTKIRQCGEA